MFKTIGLTIVGVTLFGASIFGLNELGFRVFERYSPKVEEVRRTTYEQSRSFREGTVRDLENLAMEYRKGTPEQKAAIKATALHRLAGIPDDLLTPELRQFKSQLWSN